MQEPKILKEVPVDRIKDFETAYIDFSKSQKSFRFS